jgi:cytochrome c-type biogenesis protein CcmE
MTKSGAGGPLKAKHQRLILLVVAVWALIGAGLLGVWALRSQASYFYVPSEIVARPPDGDRSVRLGGMVVKGSMHNDADGVTVKFLVSDGKASVPVRFAGIRPALFVEGSGVVAEGHMQNGVFLADNLLAKHDEKYVPREMKSMTDAQAHKAVAETK